MSTTSKSHTVSDIAIIGMALRFPGANTLEEYWHNLTHGIESVTFFSDEILLQNGVKPECLQQPNFVKAASMIADIDQFDADFFEFTPREAELTDPQQRLLLECSYEALEDANCIAPSYPGHIGVYVGTGTANYINHFKHGPYLPETLDSLQVLISNERDYAATRISYKLNLTGPSINIHTACSTSLVTVNYACNGLLNYDCDIAIAGAANIKLPQDKGYVSAGGGMHSPDGHCRPFDAKAQGPIFGSGAGIVILKRLDQALRDGDRIHAIIKGSAVNNDGAHKVGYTAPSVSGQVEVIAAAQALAEVEPESITYVEAHGTSTTLGDPIEIAALTEAFRAHTKKKQYCAIGSVKSNFGHLDVAAGMAGLIKTVLALKHKAIPPTLHFETPNPKIDFANSPFFVNDALRKWQTQGQPRRAGVSSFGIGGTNAHVILEQAPDPVPQQAQHTRDWHCLTLSAKNEASLHKLAQRYDALLNNQNSDIGAICHTALVGRNHYRHRLALHGQTAQQLRNGLTSQSDRNYNIAPIQPPRIAFLFPGQGAQYPQMGQSLYHSQPVFRETIDRCAQILTDYWDHPLQAVLWGEDNELLAQTRYTQAALFSIEYALAMLWQSWGIHATAVMGHSVGEYTAACVADVMSLEQGLKLLCARAEGLQHTPPGAMLAVLSQTAAIEDLLSDLPSTAIAAENSPLQTVIAGSEGEIEKLIVRLQQRNIEFRQLAVDRAFHSPLTEPMLANFAEVSAGISYQAPKLALVSNVQGAVVKDIDWATHWVKHVRAPVRFSTGIASLASLGIDIFLEVGPQNSLTALGKQCLEQSTSRWLTSLRRGHDDWEQLMQGVASLYLSGVRLDGMAINRGVCYATTELPTYPFTYKRYWVEPLLDGDRQAELTRQDCHPLLGQRIALADSDELRFEASLSAYLPRFLSDHKVFGHVVLPAAAYIEMAYRAAKSLLPNSAIQVQQLNIQQALVFSTDTKYTIQTVIQAMGEQHYRFKIYSRPQIDTDNDSSTFATNLSWVLHAQGEFHPIAHETQAHINIEPLSTLQQSLDNDAPVATFYQLMQETGLIYGDSFRAITQLQWRKGLALGRVALPQTLMHTSKDYDLHPAILDACLQVAATSLGQKSSTMAYIPLGFEKIQIYKKLDHELWSLAQLRPQTTGRILTLDITILNNKEQAIVVIQGLRLIATSSQSLQGTAIDLNRCLYSLDWIVHNKTLAYDTSKPHDDNIRWLVFADTHGTAQSLTEALQAYDISCDLIYPDEFGIGTTAEQLYEINDTLYQSCETLLKKSCRDNCLVYSQILYLWPLECQATNIDDSQLAIAHSKAITMAIPMYLIQALQNLTVKQKPSISLLTRGSQRIIDVDSDIEFWQAPIWGMGRVIANEFPELICTLIDLDPVPYANEAKSLLTELLMPNTETQIAYRQSERYVARLAAAQSISQVNRNLLPEQPYRVRINDYGDFNQLDFIPATVKRLDKDEVEIKVMASALNFKDVLGALGMLQDYYREQGIDSASQLPFGFECTGIVKTVGSEVNSFKPGDAVVTMKIGSLASHVTVNQTELTRIPAALSFAQAAAIPTVFMTAYYALHRLANIQQGDKVLIHSCAGGVGQAALQIVHNAGAEVFATASPGKWPILKSQGVNHIMNSRDLSFAQQIRALTRGEGIDLVLNSLPGEYIEKSLSVLKQGGRFVEIGKIGTWDKQQIAAQRPDVEYHHFDFSDIARQQPELMQQLRERVIDGFEHGQYKAIPTRQFPVGDVAKAFEFIAQAKHIGKVVVCFPEQPQAIDKNKELILNAEKSYLITGGTGALGMHACEYLFHHGARHIVLTARNDASEALLHELDRFNDMGAHIRVIRADVAQAKQLEQLFADIDNTLPPLGGIIHTAGTLDDGILSQQSWQRFEAVLDPKLDGSWYLHQLAKDKQLDFFICYSSIASILGSPGQSNYAAANSFMDSLMQHRRSHGAKGLSINWSAWSGGGMTTSMDIKQQQRLTQMGLASITPELGAACLNRLIPQPTAQAIVMPIDWPQFMKQFSGNHVPPLFNAFVAREQVSDTTDLEWIATLREAGPEKRREMVLTQLRSQIAQVLGLNSHDAIDSSRELVDLGLDSLNAVVLKNRLQTSLGQTLPTTLLFEYPNLDKLVDYLVELIDNHLEVYEADKKTSKQAR